MKKKIKKWNHMYGSCQVSFSWQFSSWFLLSLYSVWPLRDVSKAGLIKGFAGLENFRKVTNSPVFAMVLKTPCVDRCRSRHLHTLDLSLQSSLNNEFKGRKLARAVVVFPWATTLIVQAGVWKFIIDKDYGTLNTLLMKLGIIDHAVNWTPTAGAYFAWEIACGILLPFHL